MNSWIGVDFDGTLSKYDGWKGHQHVGEPIKPMCDRVRKWLSEGKTVKIMTARAYGHEGEELLEMVKPIMKFCQQEFGQVLDITCVKDYGMIELWDDRAIQLIPNTGERVDGND